MQCDFCKWCMSMYGVRYVDPINQTHTLATIGQAIYACIMLFSCSFFTLPYSATCPRKWFHKSIWLNEKYKFLSRIIESKTPRERKRCWNKRKQERAERIIFSSSLMFYRKVSGNIDSLKANKICLRLIYRADFF